MKFIMAAIVFLVGVFSLPAKETLKPGDLAYSTVAVLRIRATPDLKGKQIGKLKKGDNLRVLQLTGPEVTVDKKKARWVEFDFEGKKGYAFAGFLSTDWPLLVHSAKQWEKAEKENAASLARREAQAASLPPDEPAPFSQCLTISAFGYPAEYEAGCSDTKIEAIRNLMQQRGLSRNDAVEQYGDAYCRGWLELEVAGYNCSLDGDNVSSFPIQD